MRNGERVAGLLEDVEGGVVFVRVSLHDQRKLGLGDVALIDFVGGASGLPETELSAARGPNHLALLRDGSSLRDNSSTFAAAKSTAAAGETHMLIFRAGNGEERRIPLDGVARIYLGNFPGGPRGGDDGRRRRSREATALPAAPSVCRPTSAGSRRRSTCAGATS